MGIDISGGMIIGARGSDLCEPEEYEGDFYEWVEEIGLYSMAMYYDAGPEDTYYGFQIDDIGVEDLGIDWVKEVKQLGKKFKELTGVEARLIGTQNVW